MPIFSDEDIISGIKAGDKKFLLHLYNANRNSIRSLVIREGGNAQDAEEVLQESVIIVWQKITGAQFTLSSKLSTFLYAVAKNYWHKMLSKNKRTEPLMPELHDKPAKTKYAVEAYDLKLLSGYMRQLSETCQQLLHLFYFNEMDTKNIAVVMNFANADTVKAKKYQCFKKLQELIKNELSRSDFYE